MRLIKFLLTAFFIFFFAIAKPKRGLLRWFFIAIIVKYWSVARTGLTNTFLYSFAVVNFNSVWKFKSLNKLNR